VYVYQYNSLTVVQFSYGFAALFFSLRYLSVTIWPPKVPVSHEFL